MHNSWKLQISEWMDKQNVVYLYNGILFSLKKEGTSNIYNMDETWRHTQWNKPVKKDKYQKILL